MLFGRVLTAMITCFDRGGRLNRQENSRLARHLIDNGTEALVVAGTTGESPVLSFDEKLELFATVKEAVGDSKVIANTGSYSTTESIRLSREAEKLGADGIMLVVPYYNKPSQEGLYNHFLSIAQAVELPVMLYNVPSRTVRNLEPATVARLAADAQNIVAIKEAAGDMDQVSVLKTLLPENFTIYSGDDSVTLPMLSLGCAGVVSVASHLVGEELQKMIGFFGEGRWDEALRIHLRVFELIKTLFVQTNPVPVKTAMRLLGFDTGSVRSPLIDATPQEEHLVRQALERLNLI